jgi:hypothetical protein
VVTLRGYDGPGERGIVYESIVVFRYARERAKLDRLRQQVEDGQITLRVAKTFPAEQAAEAHRLLAAGGVRGRLVLTFGRSDVGHVRALRRRPSTPPRGCGRTTHDVRPHVRATRRSRSHPSAPPTAPTGVLPARGRSPSP